MGHPPNGGCRSGGRVLSYIICRYSGDPSVGPTGLPPPIFGRQCHEARVRRGAAYSGHRPSWRAEHEGRAGFGGEAGRNDPRHRHRWHKHCRLVGKLRDEGITMDDNNFQTGSSPRRHPTYGRISVWLLFYVVAVALVASGNALAGPCDAPVLNPIVCENSKPGNPSTEWEIGGAGNPSIQGFATEISVNQGQTVRFKIKTVATAYRLDIYRMGYYGGMGARRVDTVLPSVPLPQTQPACLTAASTGLIDCGNWGESAAWTVPSDATSGIYFAVPIREDGTPGASHIVFVVRDDNGASDLLFQTSDTTWQAYNDYGGNSLYTGSPAGRAYKVSYNRPFNTRGTLYKRSFVFAAEYPMVRWLEANGYNVSYFSDVDSDRRGAEILKHQVFLSVGHDEYWSAGQRANVEAARDAGVHLAFFSGNSIFWKTRWENSIGGSVTPYRTLVSYKETHANAKIDPLSNVWTGTWRDPRFSPPADGGYPENALKGTIFTVNGPREDAITVPESYGRLRFWRNTSVATLAAGQVATLPLGTLGYEWDEDLDNGFRPPGLIKLSSTTVSVPSKLLDYGSTYGQGTATHSLTFYRHSSGALVFAAGTIRWSWGLDGSHDSDPLTPNASTTPDIRMKQATVNLFADMGVQPFTLQPGLVAASQSSDAIRPASTITSPSAGSTVQGGTPTTITGTAADTGGGVVAYVEVSVDGGATWRLASGRNSWSYNWTPNSLGSETIKSRAVDDSGNFETPGAGITVISTCPCSLWNNLTTPATVSANDTSAVELGVKFRADVEWLHHQAALLQGAAEHGDPCRAFMDEHRDAVSECDFHWRERLGLATGYLAYGGGGDSQHYLCGVLPRAGGAVCLQLSLFHGGVCRCPSARVG